MRSIIVVVSLALGLVVLMASLSPALATGGRVPADNTFVVDVQSDGVDNNIGDNVCLTAAGKCTLRAAIQEANAQFAANPDTQYTISVPGALTFFSAPRMYSITIAGSGEDNAATGDLDIKSNLFIRTSNGLPALVNANGLDRAFHVLQTTTRTLSVGFANIWMANGSVNDGGGALLIHNLGSVTISGARITTNTVTGQVVYGGGIDSDFGGALTVSNVLLRENKVLVTNNGNGNGGAIAAVGQINITGSTLVSNTVSYSSPANTVSGTGGGLYVGCCVGTAVLSNTTVMSNSVLIGGASTAAEGGGIANIGEVMTITNSTISNNLIYAAGSNVTLAEGGGLYARAPTAVLSSTVNNNLVTSANPVIYMDGGGMTFNSRGQVAGSMMAGNAVRTAGVFGGYGGGISLGGFYFGANVLVDRSQIIGNSANDGGGLFTYISTTLAVRNSFVEGNVATNGAGIFNLGVLSVTNSTFYLNAAAKSGGGIYNSKTASVDSSTFVANIADYEPDNIGDGGGIFVANGATLYLRNSLLTGEEDRTTSGPSLPDCAGTVISQDYNLMQQSSSPSGCNMIGNTSHDKHGTFPGVVDATPGDHGGSTPTHALPAGSAAINAGDPAGCKDENGNPLTTDQRGFPRLGPCDMGAYEFVLRIFLPILAR